MKNTNTTLTNATQTRDTLLVRHEELTNSLNSIREELIVNAESLQRSDELVVSLGGDSNLPEDFSIAAAEGRRRTRINTAHCDWYVMQALIDNGGFMGGPALTSAVCDSGFEISDIQRRASVNRLMEAGHVGDNGKQRRSKEYNALTQTNPFEFPGTSVKAAKRTGDVEENTSAVTE